MMRKILSYNDIDCAQWDALVLGSETGNWFQSHEAYDFCADQPDLFKPFTIGLENEGKLRAVCVGYITVEKSVLKQFFTRRAIIIGGPVLANDATSEEVVALMNGVRQRLKIGD